MKFEEFEQRAPLYVIGALEPAEMKEVEQAAKELGADAFQLIRQYADLNEAFALSLRSAAASAHLRAQLLAMVQRRHAS